MVTASMMNVLHLSTLKQLNLTSARKPAIGEKRNVIASTHVNPIEIGMFVFGIYSNGLRNIENGIPVTKYHKMITFELFVRKILLTFFSHDNEHRSSNGEFKLS